MPKRREPGLTPLEKRFVEEYPTDCNGTQAAIRAGYSRKTANEQAAQLLAKLSIKEAIEARLRKRADKLEITQERVLQEIAMLAFTDLDALFDANGHLKRIEDMSPEAKKILHSMEFATVSKGEGEVEYIVKLRRTDKLAALDKLARHLSLYNDSLALKGLEGLADRLDRADERESQQ